MRSMEPKPATLSSTEGRSRPDLFRRLKRQYLAFYLVLIAGTVLATLITEYKVQDGFTAVPRAARWMLLNLLPDTAALGRLPGILRKLSETVLVSVMATVLAAAAAFFFGLMGSRSTQLNGVLAAMSRLVASVFRNIPVVAWAMILLLSFGQSAFTGLLALFFETFGFLTRAFIETIDETSGSAVEALRASGATYLQTIFQAVLPSVLPQILSWMLYMVETNIRSATLVGLLTGTGIGFAFDLYYKSLNYRSAALVVVCIVAAVLAIESLSNYLRRLFL